MKPPIPSKKQIQFLRELATGPKWQPAFWPKWMTELWMSDMFSTRGQSLYLTEKGFAEIDRRDAATKHEIVIVVGASWKAAAAGVKDEVLSALRREFPTATFEIASADGDFVDEGKYMVLPSRGSVEALKPMPPAELVAQVDAALQREKFLEPQTAH